MNEEKRYDLSVIGGGLAGLSTAISVAKKGYKVVLYEKETYPFHKVCGEYMSMESWEYLTSMGLPLANLSLPLINRLNVTSPSGIILSSKLDMGGFGISRYTLDNLLKEIAIANNVTVVENCKVDDVLFENDEFHLHSSDGSSTSKMCCGSFGKKSNLDVKWQRSTGSKNNKLNNYIGIKYHVIADLPDDTISLHNFKDGYCGISKVEENKFCLCYLTTAALLNKYANSVEKLEEVALSVNPHLKSLLTSVKKITKPITISQISFTRKALVENHILFTGDAAGMISPLCGNGMSMALHGGKIASKVICAYLSGTQTRQNMEMNYRQQWEKQFAARLRTGRFIQTFFGGETLTNFFVRTMKTFPSLTELIIRKTHGQSY